MKKLIVSFKNTGQLLTEFKEAYIATSSNSFKEVHHEVSFTNRKDFTKFLKNIDVLMAIKSCRPSSIYELAKLLNKDQSNINKLILFFESYGVVKIKESKQNNRVLKKPSVDFSKIEFDLVA